MSTPYIPAKVTAGAVARGGGTQASVTFVLQSFDATFSWGSSPGTGTGVYVGTAAPVLGGAFLTILLGAHVFCGVCKSDVVNSGAKSGITRTLSFVDLREYLQWDWTFCVFNKVDVRLVNGQRQKRYKHIYPADYNTLTWTYTDGPLMAYQIVGAILGYKSPGLPGGVAGGTIGSPWSWDLTGQGLFPGGAMNFPIYDIDCSSGKRLDAALNDICEKTGCVMGLKSTVTLPYLLVFTFKGYGPMPILAPNVFDNKRIGTALSGHPTNVRVLGERNCYQVMEIPMQKDWVTAWEPFLVFDKFADDIYQRGTDPATLQLATPVRFNAAVQDGKNDTEQYIGRQKALARALEITVRQYVEMRNAAAAGSGDAYADQRKFAGRSRMDMPVALYLSQILWRAFRPADAFTLRNSNGATIPLKSADIADRLLCKVSHHPVLGTMSFDLTDVADGNGYAMAKGYMVGADLFKTIRSDQFSLDFFTNAKAVWQHIPFQLDDSGEGVRFIIFDEPVVLAENLIVNVNGHKVINAAFTLTVPSVKAALVFEAERYSYWQGTWPNVSRDSVENVGGLNLELVWPKSDYSLAAQEVTYGNGQTANAKAVEIATAVLQRQYYYTEGGGKNIWNPVTMLPANFGVALSSMIDRVQIRSGATEGTYEVVDFTNERGRDNFEPERELDRRTQGLALFPGQAELRVQAEYARKLAAAFRTTRVGRLLNDLIKGAVGSDEPLDLTWFSGGVAVPSGSLLPVGTVIRKAPTAFPTGETNQATETTPNWPYAPADPAAVALKSKEFVGVVVRQSEDATRAFRVQRTGVALCLVHGPIKVGDSVGMIWTGAGNYDLLYILGGDMTLVGKCLQPISGSVTKLIKVELGSASPAAGGGTTMYKITALNGASGGSDIFTCRTWDGATLGAVDVVVAKYVHQRRSMGSEVIDGVTVTYNHIDDNNRTASDGINTENDVVFPRYKVGDVIFADQPTPGTAVNLVTWMEAKPGRVWAKRYTA